MTTHQKTFLFGKIKKNSEPKTKHIASCGEKKAHNYYTGTHHLSVLQRKECHEKSHEQTQRRCGA